MSINEAYRLVYEDMTKNGPNMFTGHYDAEHGNEKFMHGISTVMEYIAYSVDYPTGQMFSNNFVDNMLDSKK